MGVKYKINIKTEDRRYAGTDSNVFLKLYGERGISETYRLNKYIKGNAFKRNATDHVELDVGQDIGDIYKIKLSTDGRFAGSGWLPDFMTIVNDGSDRQETKFFVNQWLDGNEVERNAVNYNSASVDPIEQNSISVAGETKIFDNRQGNEPIDYSFRFLSKFTTEMDFLEKTASTISTGTEIKGSFLDYFEMCVKLEATGAVENQIEKKIGTEELIEESVAMTIPAKEMIELTPYWITNYYKDMVNMGDSSIELLVPYQKEFGGYKVIRIDAQNNQNVMVNKK
ncbi:PLAT/LH2 domain-containing protein [Methanococcus voltae]|jgi:hypothetical protein|uniref:PLAT domain-containing protein n=2 Tax=Methanococcus voltae TaxID=2188 RepID=A0A8J7RPM8_METVO|nr:PLAT/LH2 domain-containing protein [Methanococcus voltae]MBP2172995.1 hypothetical protein [Methanococcus voltae]MBP2201949.1 hypothetical protein [Methanococcus voltae]MCS3922113.1 hypothetical protein [Methanococcus voltae PS]